MSYLLRISRKGGGIYSTLTGMRGYFLVFSFESRICANFVACQRGGVSFSTEYSVDQMQNGD